MAPGHTSDPAAEAGLLEAPGDEASQPPTVATTRLWCSRRLGAAVVLIPTLALILVGSLTWTWKSGAPVSGAPTIETNKPLLLLQDLRLLGSEHWQPFDHSQSTEANAEEAWSHFVHSSGFDQELSAAELELYHEHFNSRLEGLVKGHRDEVGDNWESWIKQAAEDEKPEITQAFVEDINSQDLGYTVDMKPWMTKITHRDVEMRLGARKPSGPAPEPPRLRSSSASSSASTFHAYEKWPACAEVMRRDHNQGECGSCWAFAALSVLDGRLCVKTDGGFSGPQAQLSRTYATACQPDVWGGHRDGCQGGWSHHAYTLAATHGLPLGGAEGCIPYFASGSGMDHFDTQQKSPPCPSQCVKQNYPRPLHADRFKVGTGSKSYYFDEAPVHLRHKKDRIEQVQQELMTKGPVVAYVYVGSAFFAYSSGILNADCDKEYGNHAVSTLGWGGGDCPNGYGQCPGFFWSLLNSWGGDWGDGGEMKVAACVATSFDVPGEISDTDISRFPKPLLTGSGPAPGPGPAPLPPTPPTPNLAFTVLSGPCKADSDGCVSSPNFPSHYGSGEECTISVSKPAGLRLNVVAFSTESDFDILTVAGQPYSGSSSPHHLTVAGDSTIKWQSDSWVEDQGWKICEAEGAAPAPAPGPSPTRAVECGDAFDDLQLQAGVEASLQCPQDCDWWWYDLYGTNPFTSDSTVCAAAKYAGKQGTFKATPKGMTASFEGGERNGVISMSYDGQWDSCSIA